MDTLRLRFILDLHDNNVTSLRKPYGPFFHRWLPDGESDAITINIPKHDSSMKIWFERYGFVLSNTIEYDSKRREVNPNIVPKQGVLEGGPLFGLLLINNIKEDVINDIREGKQGTDNYISIGKKVVKEIIYPYISKFIKILRNYYGQYWLKELDSWNSEEYSLSSYCKYKLNLKWSVTDGTNWKPFIPGDKTKPITVIAQADEYYQQYISKEDWGTISTYVNEKPSPSFASDLLLNTHKYLDQDDFKQAFIEAVTAFEIASSDYIKAKINTSETINKTMGSYFNLPLDTKLSVIALHLNFDKDTIDNAIQAIKTRDQVVHEGLVPFSKRKPQVLSLMKITSKLIAGPEIRFPTANPGNAVMAEAMWEKIKSVS